jgi:hypothetical protein
MSFHKVTPVKKNTNRKPAAKKAATKKATQKRRPVSNKG